MKWNMHLLQFKIVRLAPTTVVGSQALSGSHEKHPKLTEISLFFVFVENFCDATTIGNFRVESKS